MANSGVVNFDLVMFELVNLYHSCKLYAMKNFVAYKSDQFHNLVFIVRVSVLQTLLG